MIEDSSNGWEAVAAELIAGRSGIGVAALLEWAGALPGGGSILDVGCGSGVPVAAALIGQGFAVSGVDASSTLVAAFRQRFPDAEVACEAAERSGFFGRSFDGAVAIGLMFLLAEEVQRGLIERIAGALKPGGRFLFTAPGAACNWRDAMTGRRSASLGAAEYARVLAGAGMSLSSGLIDEGGNHYYAAVKRTG